MAKRVIVTTYYIGISLISPELMASERHVKREIARLEEEVPRWRTIIDTGAPPGEETPAHQLHLTHILKLQGFL